MNEPLIVIGGGGHAKVVIDVLLSLERNVVGFVDPDTSIPHVLGVPRLGDDEAVLGYKRGTVCLINGLGSVGSSRKRRRIFEHYLKSGYGFASVVHPSAVVGRDVVWGEGVQIMAGAVLQPGTRIGDNTIINTRASVDHDCRIGSHVHIAPGATLSGQVTVLDEVHIGTSATIIQGIQIGTGSVVGAGAVVIRSVVDGVTVMGIPAKEKPI